MVGNSRVNTTTATAKKMMAPKSKSLYAFKIESNDAISPSSLQQRTNQKYTYTTWDVVFSTILIAEHTPVSILPNIKSIYL